MYQRNVGLQKLLFSSMNLAIVIYHLVVAAVLENKMILLKMATILIKIKTCLKKKKNLKIQRKEMRIRKDFIMK